jgi:hypothetical protein
MLGGFQNEDKSNRNLVMDMPVIVVEYPLSLLNFTHIYNSLDRLSGSFLQTCLKQPSVVLRAWEIVLNAN